MAAPPASPARPPPPRVPQRVPRSLIHPWPPAPPPAPLTPAAPPARAPDRRRGALVVAVIALAVLAAFAIGLLAGKSTDGGFGSDRSRGDYGPYGPYGPYGVGGGPIVIVDAREYYSYLNLSVRPTLVTVSVSFTGAACDAIAKDDPGAVERLKEAKDAALEAVEQNLRVTPPPQFQRLHETVGKVFEHTATTADKLVGCIQSGDKDCKEAQGDLVQLLDDTGRLTGDVKQLVKKL